MRRKIYFPDTSIAYEPDDFIIAFIPAAGYLLVYDIIHNELEQELHLPASVPGRTKWQVL
ncbi:hypothetical protein SDC9_167224 [bioreactor metagenome]|uniref:Uncharacterized protein n=1 Tax=bioreactor metagenome TaxID=1076179 RepID=A0A645FZ77_9ZZZZ